MSKKNNIDQTVNDIITYLQDYFTADVTTDDIMELFEDMITYFTQNEIDLVQISRLSSEQKTELYVEIKNLIDLLLSLRNKGVNQKIYHTLHQKLIDLLSIKAQNKKTNHSKEQAHSKILGEQNRLIALMQNLNKNKPASQHTHSKKNSAMVRSKAKH